MTQRSWNNQSLEVGAALDAVQPARTRTTVSNQTRVAVVAAVVPAVVPAESATQLPSQSAKQRSGILTTMMLVDVAMGPMVT